MKSEEIFSSLTEKVLHFENGDVLCLSQIMDLLTELKDGVALNDNVTTVIDRLTDLCFFEIQGTDNPDFIKLLTDGIDLLQKVCEEDRIDKEGAKAELDAMIRDVISRLESNPVIGECTGGTASVTRDENLMVFIAEAGERLSQAQELILAFEDDFSNTDTINALFRIFHTIKGECGFLKIATLGELAHNIENLLDLLRTGKMAGSSAVADILLEGVDYARRVLEQLSRGEIVLINPLSMETYLEKLSKAASTAKPTIGEVLLKEGKLDENEIRSLVQRQKESLFTKKLGEIAVEHQYISEKELNESLEIQKGNKDSENTGAKTEISDQLIKVKASKVNYLVDMIGELLIAMGQVNDTSPAFNQLRKITRSLQYAAMQLRTESAKHLFVNAKRLIRDLSRTLGKPIATTLFGEELELDRNLIEKLEEPLMHIIRNSIDHGIETPERRKESGKLPEGKISIGAERRGNNIVVSVSDDGAGLAKDRILAKAIEKGIVSESDAPTLSDTAIFNLIFMQGFSTKETVDYVSGRGVGMDIVKKMVTTAKGRIELETVPGESTVIRLFFPLSTAIIDGMIILVNGLNMIIPISSIIESIKVKQEAVTELKTGIEVVNLRGEIIPVIPLKSVLGLDADSDEGTIGVIVETSEKNKFLFLVDEIVAKREVVIKSLGAKFKDLKGISSGTVLSGGVIGLVLDVDQMVELSEIRGKYHEICSGN